MFLNMLKIPSVKLSLTYRLQNKIHDNYKFFSFNIFKLLIFYEQFMHEK